MGGTAARGSSSAALLLDYWHWPCRLSGGNRLAGNSPRILAQGSRLRWRDAVKQRPRPSTPAPMPGGLVSTIVILAMFVVLLPLLLVSVFLRFVRSPRSLTTM